MTSAGNVPLMHSIHALISDSLGIHTEPSICNFQMRGAPSLDREKWEQDLTLLPLQEKMHMLAILYKEPCLNQLMNIWVDGASRSASITYLMFNMLKAIIMTRGTGMLLVSKEIGLNVCLIEFTDSRKVFLYKEDGYYLHLKPTAFVVPYSDEYIGLFNKHKQCETYEYYIFTLVPVVSRMADEIVMKL